MATSALALNDIDAFYGDSHVLQKVSFRLGEGRLLGLLGRNGAGKSTCMNVTVGLLPPRTGTVEGSNIARVWISPEQARWAREKRDVVAELPDGFSPLASRPWSSPRSTATSSHTSSSAATRATTIRSSSR